MDIVGVILTLMSSAYVISFNDSPIAATICWCVLFATALKPYISSVKFLHEDRHHDALRDHLSFRATSFNLTLFSVANLPTSDYVKMLITSYVLFMITIYAIGGEYREVIWKKYMREASPYAVFCSILSVLFHLYFSFQQEEGAMSSALKDGLWVEKILNSARGEYIIYSILSYQSFVK